MATMILGSEAPLSLPRAKRRAPSFGGLSSWSQIKRRCRTKTPDQFSVRKSLEHVSGTPNPTPCAVAHNAEDTLFANKPKVGIIDKKSSVNSRNVDQLVEEHEVPTPTQLLKQQHPQQQQQQQPTQQLVQPPTLGNAADEDGAGGQSTKKPTARSLLLALQQTPPQLGTGAEKLVQWICDPSLLQNRAEQLGYDSVKLPLEVLTKAAVREAFTWLRAVELEMRRPHASPAALSKLSRSFAAVVPMIETTGQEVIDTTEKLSMRIRLIECLARVQMIYAKLLSATAASTANAVAPLPSHNCSGTGRVMPNMSETCLAPSVLKQHRLLGCDLNLLNRDSKTWRSLHEYAMRSFEGAGNLADPPRFRVLQIFSVRRVTEECRFATKHVQDTNKLLLWHSLPLEGCAGTLAHGLQLPPPEAPDGSADFGKGLYFTDMASATGIHGHRLLLLAEVALGSHRTLLESMPGADPTKLLPRSLKCSSVFGCGAVGPDPAVGVELLPDSTRVPAGMPVKKQLGVLLPHNQYVIFDATRVRMRYLMEVVSETVPRRSLGGC